MDNIIFAARITRKAADRNVQNPLAGLAPRSAKSLRRKSGLTQQATEDKRLSRMDDVLIKLTHPGAEMAPAGLQADHRGGPVAAYNAFNQKFLQGRG